LNLLLAHGLVEFDLLKEKLAELLAVKVLFLELNEDLFVGADFLLLLPYFLEEGMV